MKVYLVTEEDLKRLREKLELTKYTSECRVPKEQEQQLIEMHRWFNYHLCDWFNEVESRKTTP